MLFLTAVTRWIMEVFEKAGIASLLVGIIAFWESQDISTIPQLLRMEKRQTPVLF